jgi:Ca-activated chloride channel homolog
MKQYSSALLLLLLLTGLTQGQSTTPVPDVPAPKKTQSQQTVQKDEEVGEGEIIRVKANLVSVPISVINRQGKYVVDLRQEDFKIYEDGVEQMIAHFSNVDQSFSVVLLMDTSGSTVTFLDEMKTAAKSFVTQLRALDTVQPVYFHGEIKSLTPQSTNDQKLLTAGIDQLRSGPLDMGTRLYDAVDFALNTLKTASTRKAVILFTDGENTWGKSTMKGTLKEAEESDVIFYTLQYGNEPPQKYLVQLAEKTGGLFFKAADANTIKQSFAEVAEELRRQYVIGYYPNEIAQAGQERKIKVKVNRDHVVIRARRSYTYNP